MKRNMGLLWLGVAAAVTASGTASAALIININTDGSFSAAQLAVINQAKADWLAVLGFNGGDHTIRLNFSTDNAMADLGVTSGWVPDVNGRVSAANIRIKTGSHNWTLGAPAAAMDDALDTVRHEMGHGLGWTVLVPAFNAKVITDGTGNRFFDLNRNGTFSGHGVDFDLEDTGGTHAVAGTGDLMCPTTPQGQRNNANHLHAAVLAQAYGFRVIPGPSALVIFAGLSLMHRRRRLAA